MEVVRFDSSRGLHRTSTSVVDVMYCSYGMLRSVEPCICWVHEQVH
nr:MAG TPA: 39S ribosomal protein L2 [Caudoviricetes sp.]